MSPFYFQGIESSLLSLLWILLQVDCLFPVPLFGLVGFYHVPSSAAYFSVFSFCLIYCVWGLLSEGWKVTVLNFGVCPLWMGLGQCLVKVSWLGGFVPVFWWVELHLIFLEGNAVCSSEFGSVCGFDVVLGLLSVNMQGCVPAGRLACGVLHWSLLTLGWN